MYFFFFGFSFSLSSLLEHSVGPPLNPSNPNDDVTDLMKGYESGVMRYHTCLSQIVTFRTTKGPEKTNGRPRKACDWAIFGKHLFLISLSHSLRAQPQPVGISFILAGNGGAREGKKGGRLTSLGAAGPDQAFITY